METPDERPNVPFRSGSRMDKSELINLLVGKEPEAITRTLAMMAFIPAISRILEKGSVDRFADLVVDTVPKFYGLVTREHFDSVHAETCNQILSSFKTARKKGVLSYGQAQKPVNVFLKVYVDWAKRPEPDLAEKLAPLLHVPLDSLLMRFIKREFPSDYQNHVGSLRTQLIDRLSERLKGCSNSKTMARGLVGNEFSLAAINKEIYLGWQELLRSLWPGKPVTLDTLWVVERTRMRARSSDDRNP